MVSVDSRLIDMAKIADSGQCFRMTSSSDSTCELIAYGKKLAISRDYDNYVLNCSQDDFDSIWYRYFDLDEDYDIYRESIPDDDEFMKSAESFGRGIRILRQEPWEMLISFIISQRKSIPAIRSCIGKISERFGQEIDGGYAFPTPEVLAGLDEKTLGECSVGYRAGYILSASRLVASGKLDLGLLGSASYDELLESLLSVPGVGPKVSRCVMLFGFHRLEAFPRDVWINRVVDNRYNGVFPEEKYPGYAGVMQQFAFYYARSLGA